MWGEVEDNVVMQEAMKENKDILPEDLYQMLEDFYQTV